VSIQHICLLNNICKPYYIKIEKFDPID
jgi:hypothetical protein